MKIHVILILAVFILSCSQGVKKTNHGIGLKSSERVYGAFCIDETLNDTLVSFSVDLVTDEAEIILSSNIDLGISIFYEQQGKDKIYNVSLAKLEKSISGRFSTNLQSGTLFSPSGMQSVLVENFSNSVLIASVNPDSTITTVDNSGCGDMLERGIFEMLWFPEVEGHLYSIVEYYQDSQESWVNIWTK